MSPWQKNVCFGFNSTMVRPRPAFARKPAESNVLLSLVRMLPHCRSVLWLDDTRSRRSRPGKHRCSVLGSEFVTRGSEAENPLTALNPVIETITVISLTRCGSGYPVPELISRACATTSAKWDSPPHENSRKHHQSLSIIARIQADRLVCIAHLWK